MRESIPTCRSKLILESSDQKTPLYSGVDIGFAQGGPQLLRPKVADAVDWSHVSKSTYLQLGSRTLRGL